MSSVLAAAVPGFLALIGVEVLAARLRGRRVFRLNDAVSDLSCGFCDQAFGALIAGLVAIPYLLVYEHLRIWTLDPGDVVTWALAFVGKDLGYYAFHRFSHRTAFGWAAHGVHHQSEEYNLAVALRQSWFVGLYVWVFYLPVALLGVPIGVYAVASAVNLIYQFWVHTRLIGRLGPLEWVMNTPSHHRVHHGCDDQYLDRNYAGMFIVWDRMFGTFEPERDEPTYGVLYPVRTWSALRANLMPYVDLARRSWAMPGAWDKLAVWFRPPGWTPESGEEAHPPLGPGRGYDANAPRSVQIYVGLHFLAAVPGVMALMGGPAQPWTAEQWAIAVALGAFVVLTTATSAGLIEARGWARSLELGRLAVAGVGFALFSGPEGFAGIAAVMASAVWLRGWPTGLAAGSEVEQLGAE